MSNIGNGLIVIGENINATRKLRITSPRVVQRDGRLGVAYTDAAGQPALLDCTDSLPQDPAERETFLVPHIAVAVGRKDLGYLGWLVREQVRAGADIIDLCVDEMSAYPEVRQAWMRWLVPAVQATTDKPLAIDSSDTNTIRAGLEVHDAARGRVAINSFNLEEGREALAGIARERNALLFANASGREGMPQDAEQRVANLVRCMQIMDDYGIPMADRFLDPLVFPVGADGLSGTYYLAAVSELRARFPEVHIFGGHSNVSFGLPRRPVLNNAFTLLAIHAGCDAVMIDPIVNSPQPFIEFRYAMEALTARDEFAKRYLAFCRSR